MALRHHVTLRPGTAHCVITCASLDEPFTLHLTLLLGDALAHCSTRSSFVWLFASLIAWYSSSAFGTPMTGAPPKHSQTMPKSESRSCGSRHSGASYGATEVVGADAEGRGHKCWESLTVRVLLILLMSTNLGLIQSVWG